MAAEIPVWAKEVTRSGAVVFPVHGPVRMIVLPDKPIRLAAQIEDDAPGDGFGSIKEARIMCGGIRLQQSLYHMHVGVLTPVRVDHAPVATDLVDVQPVCLPPEALFENSVDIVKHTIGPEASKKGRCRSQQDERMSIRELSIVDGLAAFQDPEVPVVSSIVM